MTEADKVLNWCNGNAEAARLVADLVTVSQIADDLVDMDKPGFAAPGDRAEAMARMLHLCLIAIPANPFFMEKQGWLAPVVSVALIAWQASTRWEREKDETVKAFAFAYRDALELVVVQIAHITGGLTHAMKVNEELFRYVRFLHHDGQAFEDWKNEVSA
jgi:hypothetical protein